MRSIKLVISDVFVVREVLPSFIAAWDLSEKKTMTMLEHVVKVTAFLESSKTPQQ